MTLDKSNVVVGAPDTVGGYFFAGPVMTDSEEYPTDAVAPLPAGLTSLGYVSEEGVTKTVDRSTERIRDWNLDLVAVVTSDHNVTLQATFLESANAEVLKMIAGEDNVVVTPADEASGTPESIHVKETSDDLPHRAIAFDIKGAGDTSARVFSADVQVSSVGDVTFVKSDIIRYQVTLECFADAEGAKLHTFFTGNSAPAA